MTPTHAIVARKPAEPHVVVAVLATKGPLTSRPCRLGINMAKCSQSWKLRMAQELIVLRTDRKPARSTDFLGLHDGVDLYSRGYENVCICLAPKESCFDVHDDMSSSRSRLPHRRSSFDDRWQFSLFKLFKLL